MTEKKRKLIIYVIFGLAIIWGIFNIPPMWKHTPNASDNDYADDPDEGITASQVTDTMNPEIKYMGDWGNDPFVWKTPTNNSGPRETYNYSLSAISESNGTFWALVNGKILAVGDEIDGWKMIKITRENAVLSKNGKTIELTIKGA